MTKESKLILEPNRPSLETVQSNNGNSSTTSEANKAASTATHTTPNGPVLSQLSPYIVGYLGITPCSVQGLVRVKYPSDKPVKARRLTVTLTGIVRTKWTTRTIEPADGALHSNDGHTGKVIREHSGLRGSLEAKLSGGGKSDAKGSGGKSGGKLSSSTTYSYSTSGNNNGVEMVEIIHTHQAEDVILSLSQDLWRTTAGDGWGTLGGEHAFPFYFSLPADLPDSLESEFGSVRYVLSAVLERRGRMLNTAGRKVVDVPLAIHRATLSTLHELTRPRKWQSDPAWSASSGIAYEMSVPRATFGPGDALEAVIKMKIASPGNVRFLGASLGIKEYITYRANNITRTESTYVTSVDIDDQGHVKHTTGQPRAISSKESDKKSKSTNAANAVVSKPAGQTDRVNKDGTREVQRTIMMLRDPDVRSSITTRLISIRHKLKLKLKLAGEKDITVDCPSWLTGITRTECQQLEDWLRSKADATAVAIRQYTDEVDPPKDARARQRDRYRSSNSYHLLPGVARHAIYLQLADGIAGLPSHMTTKDASVALAVAARASTAQASGDSNADSYAYVHYSRPGAPHSGVPQYDVNQKNRRSLAFGELDDKSRAQPGGGIGHRQAPIGNEADEAARRYSMPVFPGDGADARIVSGPPPIGYYGANPYYSPYSPYGPPPAPHAVTTGAPAHAYYPYGAMPSPSAPYGFNGQMPDSRPALAESTPQNPQNANNTTSAKDNSAQDKSTVLTSILKTTAQSATNNEDAGADKNGWREIHDRPKSKILVPKSSDSFDLKGNNTRLTEQEDSEESDWEDEDEEKDPLASVRARQLRKNDKDLPHLPTRPVIHDLKAYSSSTK
ncbi:hypothetical protein BDF19DRAFT_451135 [Syncephalis fuscata]|nr:hypothetical protein BDF19DRAFT_451135 [Syncephalis fuscata]